jgi:hypothetical protein
MLETFQHAQGSPTTRTYMAQHVTSTEAEKPCSWWGKWHLQTVANGV